MNAKEKQQIHDFCNELGFSTKKFAKIYRFIENKQELQITILEDRNALIYVSTLSMQMFRNSGTRFFETIDNLKLLIAKIQLKFKRQIKEFKS